MAFRMRVEDLFRFGDKTVFTGELSSEPQAIRDAPCAIEIDGKRSGEIRINGEVHAGTPHRDLWTASQVSLTRDDLVGHEVWLISEVASD